MKITDALAFSEVYAEIKDQKMPIKTAYKFSKIAHKLEEEVKFYQSKIQEIIAAYVEKDENGNPVYTEDKQATKIVSGQEEACSKAMEELQDIDVDIAPCFAIEELEGLSLTPAQINPFSTLIIED